MAELKGKRQGRRLIVTGCLAERYRDELKKEIPEIDAVLGTGEVPRILEAIGDPARLKPGPTTVLPTTGRSRCRSTRAIRARVRRPLPRLQFGVDLPDYLYDAETPRRLSTPSHYAYLKIAEGCDYKCAFCIIPKMRGHYRSRTRESIVREAHALAARGVKELLLISQDTTFYGVDRKERGALAQLLRELNRVDGLEWIRLLYLYPTTISARRHRGDGGLRQGLQVHRPSAAARLGSGAQADEAARHARQLRAAARRHPRADPGVALRTTFIVGFPGRDGSGLRRADGIRRLGRLRPCGRVHLFARGRDDRVWSG